MKFSIGTASSSLEFEEDMRLIKSSLLYADEIELIGLKRWVNCNTREDYKVIKEYWSK